MRPVGTNSVLKHIIFPSLCSFSSCSSFFSTPFVLFFFCFLCVWTTHQISLFLSSAWFSSSSPFFLPSCATHWISFFLLCVSEIPNLDCGSRAENGVWLSTPGMWTQHTGTPPAAGRAGPPAGPNILRVTPHYLRTPTDQKDQMRGGGGRGKVGGIVGGGRWNCVLRFIIWFVSFASSTCFCEICLLILCWFVLFFSFVHVRLPFFLLSWGPKRVTCLCHYLRRTDLPVIAAHTSFAAEILHIVPAIHTKTYWLVTAIYMNDSSKIT